MTREEIVKAADEAVEMFGVMFSSYPFNYSREIVIECAVIHYEKIVERDEFWFKNVRETIEIIIKHFKVPVSSINSPLLEDSKAILQELKSRL